MKGYIYTMAAGADPGHGWILNDPIFGRPPTLGACVPNIRRSVEKGDHIFAISGRVAGDSQYVVGGFRVAEKIDALAAYRRFPQNRLSLTDDGDLLGNIIVDESGKHHPLDYHAEFERRVENYIVGDEPVYLGSPDAIRRARQETLPFLSDVFQKEGNRIFDVVGRWRRLDGQQVQQVRQWLADLDR